MATIAPEDVRKEELTAELIRKRIALHPANLMPFVRCLDPETTEEFKFAELGWEWQQATLNSWVDNPKTIILKARQLGITWLAGLYALHMVQFRPGSRTLIFSIKETEASKAVGRIWDMRESLPTFLRTGEVLKPTRGARPSTELVIRHDDGRVSSVIAFASSKAAGHGETAALVILDEFSRQEYASDTWKAVLPTASKGGRIVTISTGNGVSSVTRQGDVAGNFFHWLWTNADENNIEKEFLAWDRHPNRDEDWYTLNANPLPAADRGEQYPRDENEAFILTGDPYFDREALMDYRDNRKRTPLYRFDFVSVNQRKARAVKHPLGKIWMFELPNPMVKYAIALDTATGRGEDYSSATVIDLSTMAFVARFHGRMEGIEMAEQLHFLGKLYNTAIIAVEAAGGFGEPVILSLRSDKHGRPKYPKLYRHRQETRPDSPQMKTYGYPVNTKTRPLLLTQLELALRERAIPYMDTDTINEYQTFVHRNTNPSPRAQEGCNDDRVMSDAIAVDLYRQLGVQPSRKRRRSHQAEYKPYDWS